MTFFLFSCQKELPHKLPIFKISDFEICNLPLPKGYPNSQTHSGIQYVKDSLGGYQYWLTTSPFPNGGVGERYENPMVYYANERTNRLPPINFNPYKHNPIMEAPKFGNNKSAYNSDPDILIHENKLIVINRSYQPTLPIYKNSEYFFDKLKVYALEGIFKNNILQNFTKPKGLFVENTYSKTPTFMSPSLVYYRDKYRFFYLVTNTYNDGKPTEKMIMLSDSSMNGGFELKKEMIMLKGGVEPWHFSVFNYEGKLYSIVCGTTQGVKKLCYQYLAEFDETLSTYTIYQRPLTILPSYRGSAFVREDGLFVLYTTIIKKIPGSKSIDGRDVLMTSLSFEKLLKEVKK